MEAGKPIKQAERGHRRSMIYPKDHAGPISNRYRTVTDKFGGELLQERGICQRLLKQSANSPIVFLFKNIGEVQYV